MMGRDILDVQKTKLEGVMLIKPEVFEDFAGANLSEEGVPGGP